MGPIDKLSMALEIFAWILFAVFAVAFGLLAVMHKEANKRMHKLFLFGFLISVLYACLYSLYQYTTAGVYLVFLPIFTAMAIMTQYLHIRAVEKGHVKGTKMVVNLAKEQDLEKSKLPAKKEK
jgi:hypothetical protein